MAVVYFRSLDLAEVIDVEFLTPQGGVRLLKLLVDSGFTGKSSVVLGRDASDLIRAQVPPAQVSGALQGAQWGDLRAGPVARSGDRATTRGVCSDRLHAVRMLQTR